MAWPRAIAELRSAMSKNYMKIMVEGQTRGGLAELYRQLRAVVQVKKYAQRYKVRQQGLRSREAGIREGACNTVTRRDRGLHIAGY